MSIRREQNPSPNSISTHHHKSQATKVVHDLAPVRGGLCFAAPSLALGAACEFRPTGYLELR